MPPQLVVKRFPTMLRDKHHMILAVPRGMIQSLDVWHDRLPLRETLSGSPRGSLWLQPPELSNFQELPGRAGGLRLVIIKAYADQLGLVGLINHYVPTAMDVDAGTVVLGLVFDTLSGRSPLYRLEEFFAHQDTELLLGKAIPPQAFTDDTVGRVLDRLYDFGTMRLFTACAVRASMRFDLERRSGHFDTTSRSVWGDYSVCRDAGPALPGDLWL